MNGPAVLPDRRVVQKLAQATLLVVPASRQVTAAERLPRAPTPTVKMRFPRPLFVASFRATYLSTMYTVIMEPK